MLLGSPRSNPWGGLFQDRADFDIVYHEELKQEVVRNKRAQKGELPLYVPTARGWGTGQAYAILAFMRNPGQTGHVLLLVRAGIPIIEHMTNLDAVPDTGARLVALPAPVRGMGSFPLRAVAWTDYGVDS